MHSLGRGFVVLLGMGVLSTGSAAATGRISYPFPTLYDISCPSTSLCVAIDKLGHADISTDPTDAAPTWRGSTIGSLNLPAAVSCPSTALCVVVDSAGRAGISTNPAGPSPIWKFAPIGGGETVMPDVSCGSTSLCVAVDYRGDAATTTDPTSANPTWRVANVDSTGSLRRVSCVSTALCVAVDSRGNAVISTDPTAISPIWSAPTPIDSSALSSISCPSTSLCVAADVAGRTVRSTNPTAAAPEWSTPAPTTSTSLSDISCASADLCVAAGGQMLGGHDDVSPLRTVTPTDTTPAWWVAPGFPMAPGFFEAPATVSCPSTSLCVLAFGESVMISTNAAARSPTWRTPTHIVEVPKGAVSLRGSPVTRGPKLVSHLDCAAEWIEECRGTATVTTTETIAANGYTVTGVDAIAKHTHHRTVVIGLTKFATGLGGNGKNFEFEVRLNHTGRRLLAKFKRLRATLRVTAAASELRVPPKVIAIKTVRVTFTAKKL